MNNMKKIYLSMLMALSTAATLFTSCSLDNDAYITAGEDDYPRILNTELTETSGGAPCELPTIARDVNFNFTAIVTPTQYTTVEWFIDGESVCTGNTIDVPLLAGEYDVKITATTTKGLSTYRNCILKVVPLDTDPSLADDEKSRWFTPGTSKTIDGKNLEGVVGAEINGIPVEKFENNGSSLNFDIPEMEEGLHRIVLIKSDKSRYGCGKVNITTENYVEPGVVEETLWSGSFDVTWGTPFDLLKDQSIVLVSDGVLKVGSVLRIYVSGNGQGALTSSWWNNLITGAEGEANRGDIMIEGDQILEYTLTEASIRLINEQNGMFVVGDGYNISKVTVFVQTQSPAQTLWEGSFGVTWGTPFNELAARSKELVADGTIAVGKVVKIYVSGNGQGALTSAWWNNLITGAEGEANRGDIMIEGDQVLEYTLTDESIRLINEQDGMFVVGDGYTVSKITIE